MNKSLLSIVKSQSLIVNSTFPRFSKVSFLAEPLSPRNPWRPCPFGGSIPPQNGSQNIQKILSPTSTQHHTRLWKIIYIYIYLSFVWLLIAIFPIFFYMFHISAWEMSFLPSCRIALVLLLPQISTKPLGHHRAFSQWLILESMDGSIDVNWVLLFSMKPWWTYMFKLFKHQHVSKCWDFKG